MVERVRRRCLRSRADGAVVATDDERIARAVWDFGGDAVLTPPMPSGTARVAHAARQIDAEYLVNVQGDQPFVDPAHIDAVIDGLHAGAPIVTLSAPLDGDPADPSKVKVVTDRLGRALYFSRAAIPYRGPYRQHVGIYGFRADVLRDLPSDPMTAEDLEQLAWLEHGRSIHVIPIDVPVFAIDTPDQLAAAQRMAGARFPEESHA
jgi:CMP-2-keto-3-deoxyoctulosonic acid synthetase